MKKKQQRPDKSYLLELLREPLGDTGDILPQMENYPYFAKSRNLGTGLVALSVLPGAEQIALQGLELCDYIFSRQQSDSVERMASTYRRILSARPIQSVPSDLPLGDVIEWSAFFVYRREENPVGIGGLYRYLERAQEIWLGRFGIISEERGSGMADILFDSLESDARVLAGSQLLAFTEPDNQQAIRFYQRHGMQKLETGYHYAGSVQLVLAKSL